MEGASTLIAYTKASPSSTPNSFGAAVCQSLTARAVTPVQSAQAASRPSVTRGTTGSRQARRASRVSGTRARAMPPGGPPNQIAGAAPSSASGPPI